MPRKLSPPTSGVATDEETEEIARLEQAAEARLEEERVSIRWPRGSLQVIREAAQLHGVPYQTYVKQVAFRQALTDMKDAAAAGVTSEVTSPARVTRTG